MKMTGTHNWVCRQQLKISSSQLHKKEKNPTCLKENLVSPKEIAMQKQGALEKTRAQTSFPVIAFKKSQLDLHPAVFTLTSQK